MANDLGLVPMEQLIFSSKKLLEKLLLTNKCLLRGLAWQFTKVTSSARSLARLIRFEH